MRGFTLIEVIVSLVVMGAALGVVTLAWPRNDHRSVDPARALADSAALAAWRSGQPVAVSWPDSAGRYHPALFLPDGRVLGAPATRESTHAP